MQLWKIKERRPHPCDKRRLDSSVKYYENDYTAIDTTFTHISVAYKGHNQIGTLT